MNRGRRATKGLDDAAPIAQRRGCLMKVEYGPESVCDFLIRTVELVIFVRVVRIEKIVASVSEIGHKCRAIIAEAPALPAVAADPAELPGRTTNTGLTATSGSPRPAWRRSGRAGSRRPEPRAKGRTSRRLGKREVLRVRGCR